MVDSPSQRRFGAGESLRGVSTMPRANEVSDKSVLQKVNQRLMGIGTGSRNGITAAVSHGDVTVSGSIQFEHQRRNVMRAASGVAGVRRVIDHVQVLPQKSKWS